MLVSIWQRNLNLFERLVRNILFDRSLVEDALQEAFTRILQSGRQFPNEREAYSYMRQVVVSTTIDFYRRQIRRSKRDKRYEPVITCATPLDLMIREEEKDLHGFVLKQVRKAMQELSREQREALDLVFNRQEKTLKEICRETGIPYSTLRSRMLAGLDQIRKKLREKGLMSTLEEVNAHELR